MEHFTQISLRFSVHLDKWFSDRVRVIRLNLAVLKYSSRVHAQNYEMRFMFSWRRSMTYVEIHKSAAVEPDWKGVRDLKKFENREFGHRFYHCHKLEIE